MVDTPELEKGEPAEPSGSSWRKRVGLPRRWRIFLFAVVAASIVIAAAWVATLSAPDTGTPSVVVANASNLEVDPGAANAVVFPFQLAPDSQSDEDGAPTVTSASFTATVVIPACGQSTPAPCPGVILEILTANQVSQFPTGTNVTPVWCTNSSAGTCATTAGGAFTVDLTVFAGQSMDLLVWSPSGVQWTDLSAQGSWSP
jgi:hypothetical protein